MLAFRAVNSIKIFAPLGRRCKLHGAIHPHRIQVSTVRATPVIPSIGRVLLRSFFLPRIPGHCMHL
jgi:hypothetical protein